MVDKKVKISVAIPTFNSSGYILNALENIVDDDRVDDVVISDDTSNDYEKLEEIVGEFKKVRVFSNPENLGGFLNKRKAVDLCKNEWVIILDSDNTLSDTYINKLCEYEDLAGWRDKTLYCPDFGLTKLNYTGLGGKVLTKDNIGWWLKWARQMTQSFLNTGNYFANREQYLKVANPLLKGHVPCSIAFTCLWLQSRRMIYVVSGLCYTHRITRHGYWGRNAATFKPIVDGITKALIDGYEYKF